MNVERTVVYYHLAWEADYWETTVDIITILHSEGVDKYE
jgi:hypothetical protein